jgi:hypothetical protein
MLVASMQVVSSNKLMPTKMVASIVLNFRTGSETQLVELEELLVVTIRHRFQATQLVELVVLLMLVSEEVLHLMKHHSELVVLLVVLPVVTLVFLVVTFNHHHLNHQVVLVLIRHQ